MPVKNFKIMDHSSAPSLPEEGPFLIAAPDGTILFANTAFISISGCSQNIYGNRLEDCMIFSSHDGNIESGQHKVRFTNNNEELFLQFDWIDTIDNQKFLIISGKKITRGEKLLDYISGKIKEKQNSDFDHTTFTDLSFDACCITEIGGNFITINQNFTDLFGYTIQDIASKSFIDLAHPEDKNQLRNAMQNLRQNADYDPIISTEIICLNKQNHALWTEWKHKRIGNKIYSTGRDLTPLKAYKDSLDRQEKKLSEAEAIGHIGQWRWPVGDEKIEFSYQLYKIFGVSQIDFRPTLDNITKMIHRSDSGRMMQVFQRAIIEQNNYDMDFRITRPDGDIRFIHCEGRCEIDAEDDVTALYGIMQDVTESTKREIDLRQAKENVERAYAAKTQFLANMSHELRTPLNAIIGFSEMIERQLLGPIGNEKYLEYIGGIRQSGEHLLDLISDILDMSKIEAGKYELNLEKFNIAKVIRMAAHMMEGRALDSDIKINVDISHEELMITADRRACMQMILNLISNAIKFSNQGKTVNIRLREKEDHFLIQVEDKGIGIPANKLANITMPFEQAESHYTRKYEGSGLGLSITKELAEIHGGSLHIESTIHVGTTVTIKLPYVAQT